MSPKQPATVKKLSATASRAFLRANSVGRLAFLNRGRVDIQPVHYAARGDWLFLRSGEGSKLTALAHNPYVAFEIDDVRDASNWKSVVARGTMYMLDAADRQRAVRALREIMPEALTSDDPTPERDVVYGIHIDEVSGRMAGSGTKKRR
jgi:nitroimidazol reductase NimA-like FMN-containing flavoprotein (pyridoxamine 5'-phosphate oxidase superfamily)